MHKQPGSVRLSRRAFLHRFGVAATTLAAAQLVSACSDQQSPNHASNPAAPEYSANRQEVLRVGVLLPQSGIYPLIGTNFRAGLELYQEQAHGDQGIRPLRLLMHEYGTLPS
ncbi:MAG TPA: hypothetical protein VFU22_09385, partial [Roseiflexaceae bacterium]|nr:hypothetical protein [Roseiflexaceae bacterium]